MWFMVTYCVSGAVGGYEVVAATGSWPYDGGAARGWSCWWPAGVWVRRAGQVLAADSTVVGGGGAHHTGRPTAGPTVSGPAVGPAAGCRNMSGSLAAGCGGRCSAPAGPAVADGDGGGG